MTDPLRRLIAYIAAVVVEGHAAAGVFDFEIGSRFTVSGSIEGDTVDVTDETDGLRLVGELPRLFQADGSVVTLEIEDDEFTAVDTASGDRLTGRVSGRNIDLHDETEGKDYVYCL